ncbi:MULTISPECIES: NAD(P)H-nitrite reductase [unclassified Oceanispirochaeta]|uniref:NAD(P)H-nitrite reductase n=1 Tax=unclassified Oceanispirochaeta TaxID=2635722 RepID=UPI000E08F219|nr:MULTISPECIES: NAD(P)H-nitrite reductase [unclassified Oceanispirochaeta]MBF9017261.1 NAD(P)H-nitrite reductase [Oceanispirochaeta sp. M2]NPD75374.1 NAD(P)H-nitrite reductase [Oceanispirochaeta sp. M1]RDG28777.1 NAD(P)H-nitrite reductase [Oceanispirochaeta sp. M1]
MKEWKSASDNEIVCYCKQINKKIIVDSILTGNNSLQSITEATTACSGGDCKNLNPSGKCCSADIIELIRLYSETQEKESSCSCCCGN